MVDGALGSLREPLGWIHFTGGEPLLDRKHFVALAKETRKRHTGSIGIATNGYWGQTRRSSESMVDEMKKLGVNGVLLSVDSFHQKVIPIKVVENAAMAIAEAGLRNHSWIVASLLSDDTGDLLLTDEESLRMASAISERSGIPVARNDVRAIGRGSETSISTRRDIPQGMCRDLACCLGETGPFEPKMIWIDPYSNVLICYGVVIGSLRHNTLQEIIDSYDPKSNFILQTLAERGPKGLHALAEETFRMTLSGPFRDECDLCFQSRRQLRTEYPSILGPAECYPE